MTDVVDAVLLRRLFEGLFARGVRVAFTSNREPERLYERDGMVKLPLLAAAHAATLCLKSPSARSGRPSGPEGRALAAWMPRRSCGAALVPAQCHRLLHCL